MSCPDENTVVDFLHRRLPSEASSAIEAHMDSCAECRRLVGELGRGLPVQSTFPHEPRDTDSSFMTGALVGRYVLLGTLGSGGMGTVYRAYDPDLDRAVAIKLLHPGGDDAQARLLREAQALARVSHPNVIVVHDVGMFEGRVFVAMELVRGRTLTAWLRAARRPWREIVRQFAAAGRGLAAAHAAGLIHRDFKPDNVLVGDDGRVLVTDFGLARAAAETPEPDGQSASALDVNLTATGAFVGTPAYMAPEQYLDGTVDARTDQFGFCVALFEGLYGVRPFRGASVEEVAQAIVDGRWAVRPRDRRIPAWLDRVLTRALRVAQAERFPSMDELLAALGRDSRSTRAAWLVGAALVVAIGVGIALTRTRAAPSRMCTGAHAELAGVWDRPRRDAIRRAFLATHRGYAMDAWLRTEKILDRYAGAWTEMVGEACAATRIRGVQTEEVMTLRMDCLGERKRGLAALATVLADADAAVLEKAIDTASRLEPLEACADVAALSQLVRPPADAATRARVEAERGELAAARVLRDAGKLDAALTKATAAEAASTALGYAPLRAEALYLLGDLLDRSGQPADAETTLYRSIWSADEGRDDRVRALAWARLVSVVGDSLGRPAEARALASHAAAAAQRVGSDDALEVERLNALGKLALSNAEYDAAEDAFRHAVNGAERLHGRDSPAVARLLNNLAALEHDRGRYEASLALHRRSLAIREHVFGPAHPTTGLALGNIATVYISQGRYSEGAAEMERALAILEPALGREHPTVATMLNNLGEAYRSQRRYDAALGAHRRALAARRQRLGDAHPDVAASLDNIGAVLQAQGKHEEAAAAHREALAAKERSFERDHPSIAVTLLNLASVLTTQGRAAAALPYIERAHAIYLVKLGKDAPDLGFALYAFGRAYLALDDSKAAVPVLERALVLLDASSFDELSRAEIRFALARALWDRGVTRERALALARQARDDYAHGDRWRERAEIDAWLAARP